MRLIGLALFCLAVLLGPCRAQSPAALCRAAIASAERSYRVPDRLMQAVGIVESGRPDERGSVSAWPWTINVEGTGYVFATKAEAIAAVQMHQANGIRSIDVGCMQVNLIHHGDAFTSLEQAFDPVANANYAARFLLDLLDRTGSWPRAAAGYHSMTPEIGADYARKVLAVWARPGLGDGPMLAQYRRGPLADSMVPSVAALTRAPPTTQPGALPAAAPASFGSSPIAPSPGGLGVGGSMTARMLPTPGATQGAGVTGRTLASYRAMPTRVVTLAVPRG